MPALPAVVRDRGSQENFDALNTRQPSRDFGKVTVLPGTPAVGDTCYFKAAEGVYWTLLYTKESNKYPWNKVGGPPLRKRDTEEFRETASPTPQTTGAPSITCPLGMEAKVTVGCGNAITNQTTEPNDLRVGFFNKGVAQFPICAFLTGAGGGGGSYNTWEIQVLEAGAALQARYYSNSSRAGRFYILFIEIDPVRVG